MDVVDGIKKMIADSGRSARSVSRELGRAPNYLGTTLSKNSDMGTSNLARVANLLGWHVVLKQGDIEMEVTPRPDKHNKNSD